MFRHYFELYRPSFLFSIGFVCAGILLLIINKPGISNNEIITHLIFGASGGFGLGLIYGRTRTIILFSIAGAICFPLFWFICFKIANFFSGLIGSFNSITVNIYLALIFALMGFLTGWLISYAEGNGGLRLKMMIYGAVSFAIGFVISLPILLFFPKDLAVYSLVLMIVYGIGGVGLGMVLPKQPPQNAVVNSVNSI